MGKETKKPGLTIEDVRNMKFDPPLTELECFIGISARGRRERERKALEEERNSRENPSSTPHRDKQSLEENLVLARRDQHERAMGEKTSLNHTVGSTKEKKKKKQVVVARDVTEDDIADIDPSSSEFDGLVHVGMKARKLYKEEAKRLNISHGEDGEKEEEEFHCPTPEAAAKRKRMLMREKNLKKRLVIENPNRVFIGNKKKLFEREGIEEDEEEGDAKVVKKKNRTDNCNEVKNWVLPKEILDEIRRVNGSEVKLVIQKKLFQTDLESGQNWLSIPLNQLENREFLTEDEQVFLRGRTPDRRNRNGFPVLFIEPNGNLNLDLKFKWWDMPKESGKNRSSIYLFNGKWHDVCTRHQLDTDTIVQVWSFRYTSDKSERNLGFAMVIVGRVQNGDRNGNGNGNRNRNGNRNANGNGKGNGSSGSRSETSGSPTGE